MKNHIIIILLILIFSTYSYAECDGVGYWVGFPGEMFKFCWKRNTEPDLAGYRSYISMNSGDYKYFSSDPNDNDLYSTYSLIRDAEGNIVDHPDESPQHSISTPGLYYFVLTAYDTEGLESAPSNEVSCLIKDPITSPTNLTIILDLGEVSFKNTFDLEWQSINEEIEFNKIEI